MQGGSDDGIPDAEAYANWKARRQQHTDTDPDVPDAAEFEQWKASHGDIVLGPNGNAPEASVRAAPRRRALMPSITAARDATANVPGVGTELRNRPITQAIAGVGDVVHGVRHPIQTGKSILTGIKEDASKTFLTPVVGAKNNPDAKTGLLPYPHLPMGATVTKQNTPSAISLGEQAHAGVNTAANAGVGFAGHTGRVLTAAGLGAFNNPEEPIRGAVAGSALGEVLHQTIHGATVGTKAVAPHVVEGVRGGAKIVAKAGEDVNAFTSKLRQSLGKADPEAVAREHGISVDDAKLVIAVAKQNGGTVAEQVKAMQELDAIDAATARTGYSRQQNFAKFKAEEGATATPSANDATIAPNAPNVFGPIPVSSIALDPARFQFKAGGDEQGVGRELKAVDKYNPMLAGVLSVWKDPANGQTYILNGHHRLDLAKRSGTESVNVQYIDAKDAGEARAHGALINIAEGRGTPLDAARFFRQSGLTVEAIKQTGVSPTGAVARNGLALSRLAPDVFDRVASGKISEGHGAIIGAELSDSPAMQRAAASLVENSPKTLSGAQVQELVSQVRNAGEANVSQESLFGKESAATSLIYQRADVAAEIKRRLSSDKRLFGYVSKEGRASELQRGGNVIDVDQSAQLAQVAAVLEEVFGKEAHAVGPVGSIITQAAREVANGAKVKTVVDGIYETVRQAVSEAIAGRGAARGSALEARDRDGQPAAGPNAAGRSLADELAAGEAGRVVDSTDPAQGGLLSPYRSPATPENEHIRRAILDQLTPEERQFAQCDESVRGSFDPEYAAEQAKHGDVPDGQEYSAWREAQGLDPQAERYSDMTPAESPAELVRQIRESLKPNVLEGEGPSGEVLASPSRVEHRPRGAGEPERLVSLATKFTDGPIIPTDASEAIRIFTAEFWNKPDMTLEDAIDTNAYDTGFLTSSGRFVTGVEAAHIAFNAGQLRRNSTAHRAITSGVLPLDWQQRGAYGVERDLRPTELSNVHARSAGAEAKARVSDAPLIVGEIQPGGQAHGFDLGARKAQPTIKLIRIRDSYPDPAYRGRVMKVADFEPNGGYAQLRGHDVVRFPAEHVEEGYAPADTREWRDAQSMTFIPRAEARATFLGLESGEGMGKLRPSARARFDDRELHGEEQGDIVPRTYDDTYEKGYTDTETGKFLTGPEAAEKFGSAETDIGPKGRRKKGQSGFELFNPADEHADVYGVTSKPRDLFGNVIEDATSAQGSLFGGKEGTVESRSLTEHEAAARSELVKLRQMLGMEGDTRRRAQIASQIIEHEKLVNRGGKIGPDEMSARAASTLPTDAQGLPIVGPDQAMLFSPANAGPLLSPLGNAVRKALGVKAINPAGMKDVHAVSEISRKLAEAVGVPVRQGRGNFARLRAAGWFNPKSETIRVSRMKQLGVVAHEIGHYVSQKYTIKSGVVGPMGKELFAAGKALYGSRKPAGGYAEEGVAEFFKAYVADTQRLASEFPLFSQHMERVLNAEPALRDALLTARNDFERFQAAPSAQKIAAMVSVSPKGRALPTTRQIVAGWFDDLHEIAKTVEELGGEADPAKNAEVLARLTRGGAGQSADMLAHGVLDFNTKKPVTKGFEEILDEVGRDHLQGFREYLVAARAVELANRGIDSGIDLTAAKDVAKAGHAQFLEAARKLYWYQNALLKYVADAGLLTADEFKVIRDANPNRVPFFRVIDPAETGAAGGHGGGMARNSSGVMRIKGSDRVIIDPLESIVRETYSHVDRANKHFAAQTLVKMALDTQGGGRWVELLAEKPKDRLHINVAEVHEQLDAMGYTLPKNLTVAQMEAMAEGLTAFHVKSRGGLAEAQDLVMPVLIEGERKWVQIKDRPLWDALQSLGVEAQPAWAKILEIPARVLRRGAVLSPEFIPKNPIRDAFHLAIFTKGPTRLPFSHLIEGAFHLARKDNLYEAWIRNGGENAGIVGFDRADVQKALKHMTDPAYHKLYRIVRHPWDALGVLSQAAEDATRLGEFSAVKRAKMKGGMPEKSANMAAALAARTGTLDFASGGTHARNVNRIVAFFNANVLGLKQFAEAHDPRNLATPEGRAQMLTTMARGAAFITLPTLALYLAQKDDPAFQELPEHVKATGWVWIQRSHDGTLKHIWWMPRPQVLGYAYGYLPQKALEFINREDRDALTHLTSQLVDEAVPPVLPTAMRPLIENWANRSTLTGHPIVPDALSTLPAGKQATRYTGETARAIGDATNYSPAKIENLVSGFTGGVGRYGLLGADAIVREGRSVLGKRPLKPETPGEADPFKHVPSLRAFVKPEPGADAQSVTRLYDAFEQAESRRREWRGLLEHGEQGAAKRYLAEHRAEILSVATHEETGAGGGPLRAYYQEMSKLAAARREVEGGGRNDSAAVSRVRVIEQQMVRLARRYWVQQGEKRSGTY